MSKITRFLSFPIIFACLLLPAICHAVTSIAHIDGRPQQTTYAAWNYPNSKEADQAALKGCGTRAKENNITQSTKKCNVFQRQKNAGAGAIVCGKTGCTTSSSFDSEQDAVDDAYQRCEHNRFGECQKTDITSWWDDVGYRKKTARNAAPAKTCGPPPGQPVRSTYTCNNGDCVRTFENGCAVRFQAPYCHDPATGKWDWRADGC